MSNVNGSAYSIISGVRNNYSDSGSSSDVELNDVGSYYIRRKLQTCFPFSNYLFLST